MRKISSVSALLMLWWLCSVFCTQTNAFTDDFEDNKDDGWARVVGEWVVKDGRYLQVQGGDLWQRAVLDEINVRNEKFHLVAKGGLVKGTQNNGWVGVVFLHQGVEEGKGGFYSFAAVYDGRNIARLFKSPSGKYPDVAWKKDAPFTPKPGEVYEFVVIVEGNVIKCLINGKELIKTEDPEIWKEGKVGLFSTNAESFFEEITVTGPGIPEAQVNPGGKMPLTWARIKGGI
ncbi:hypothetical protein J7M22_13070 [Candidatus Poribacteria bacterium]|nr:hypothetical protein [Candidatus Poribacteria bacterium]